MADEVTINVSSDADERTRLHGNDKRRITEKEWKKIKFIFGSSILVLIVAFIFACLRLGFQVLLLNIFFEKRKNYNSNNTMNKNMDDNEFQSEFVSLLLICSQVICILEYIGLFYGLSRFHKYIRKAVRLEEEGAALELPAINVCNKINNCFKDILLPSCNDGNPWLYFIIVYIIVCFAGCFHLILSFIPPILHIIWASDIVISYDDNKGIATAVSYFSFLSHLLNFAVRVAMFVITTAICALWNRNTTENLCNRDTKKTNNYPSLHDFKSDYKTTGKFVSSLHGIFQEWFVLKWIAYFLNILGDITLAIKVLFGGPSLMKLPIMENAKGLHVFIFVTMHLIYNFVAFTAIYICGTLINYYHGKYYKKSQKAIREAAIQKAETIQEASNTEGDEKKKKNDDEEIKNNMLPEFLKYNFTPSLCGLSVPLHNAGYLITFALAIVGVITTTLTTFVQI